MCQEHCDNPDKQDWMTLPPGSYIKGSPVTELCRSEDENQYHVTLTHALSFSSIEVTQQAFQAIIGFNPSFWSLTGKAQIECGPTCPVEQVTWHMAAAYCYELSRMHGLESCYQCKLEGGKPFCEEAPDFQSEKFYECPGYRLPTEAEWEYAYRAGTRTPYYTGNNSVCFDKADPLAETLGWYYFNFPEGKKRMPQPVATKPPNGWRLYDMAGNLEEWVQDWSLSYQPELLDTRPELQTNPLRTFPGRKTGEKLFKGGAYDSFPASLRAGGNGEWKIDSSARGIGFRVVRTLHPLLHGQIQP
jgi:formylglycine-generating enzyme required for sulfatase activity